MIDAILNDVANAGLRIEVSGGRPFLVGDPRRAHPELLALLKAHRDGIVAALTPREWLWRSGRTHSGVSANHPVGAWWWREQGGLGWWPIRDRIESAAPDLEIPDEVKRLVRPAALGVVPEAIPEVLRSRKQWVVWRYDLSERLEWAKVPYQPGGVHKARSNDPSTWATFDAALRETANRDRSWAGVGYVFSADDPFSGVDLDDCRDPATGVISDMALRVIGELDSYCEVSPSATGVKLILDALKPEGRCAYRVGFPDLDRVEVYDRGRFFALTGRRVEGTPEGVTGRQSELEMFCRDMQAACMGAEAGDRLRGLAREEASRPARQSGVSIESRARAYARACPPAVSGQGGHNTTFAVARAVVWGFDLGAEAGFRILWEAYNPSCRPPWSEKELRHKCVDADAKPSSRPRGWLLGGKRVMDAPLK